MHGGLFQFKTSGFPRAFFFYLSTSKPHVTNFTRILLLFHGAGFTNARKCDKICNMNKCVLFSSSHRAGRAITRRLIAFCVIFVYLFSMSAFAIEIPESITTIEEGAFLGDTSITSVKIPSSVSYIGKEAFADCTKLTTITIYGKDVTFEANALGRLGETRTIIGYEGTSVEEYANLYNFTFKSIVTKAKKLLAYADTLVGTSYSTYDCVGFVNHCYLKALGIKTGAATTNNEDGRFPNTSNFGKLDQYNTSAVKITKISQLKPGDIICWKNDDVSYCTHVGLYVGAGVVDGKTLSTGVFIDSSRSDQCVDYRAFTSYYTRNFMFGWRLIVED